MSSERSLRWPLAWLKPTALAIAVLVGGVRIDAAIEAGQTFPRLDAFQLEGTVPDVAAARVVIVDFWASWCAPCKAAFPVLNELHATYRERGVVIIGVSVDKRAADVAAFVKRMEPGFAIVHDPSQKLVGVVGAPAMPSTYILDGRGVVRFAHAGFFGEKSRREYVEQIELLLGEQNQP